MIYFGYSVYFILVIVYVLFCL